MKSPIPKAEPQNGSVATATVTRDAENFEVRRLAPSERVGLQKSSPKPATRARPLILVVDDEPDIVFVTKTRLQMSGYDVAVAVDGEIALARIKELRPDLVLLDLKMPKMNGYQLCKTVKADPDLSSTLILVCSATSSLGMSPEKYCRQIGADGYFRKPYNPRELLQEISRLLAQKKEKGGIPPFVLRP